jgi:predicted ferric reductase
VRLHVPEISKHEWHLFSIASAPDDKYLSIMFRSFGTWTTKLETLLASKQKPCVIVDGYYGSRDRLRECHEVEHVVLVAGGTGVTPLLSIFRVLYNFHGKSAGAGKHARTKTVDLI